MLLDHRYMTKVTEITMKSKHFIVNHIHIIFKKKKGCDRYFFKYLDRNNGEFYFLFIYKLICEIKLFNHIRFILIRY